MPPRQSRFQINPHSFFDLGTVVACNLAFNDGLHRKHRLQIDILGEPSSIMKARPIVTCTATISFPFTTTSPPGRKTIRGDNSNPSLTASNAGGFDSAQPPADRLLSEVEASEVETTAPCCTRTAGDARGRVFLMFNGRTTEI